MMPNKKMNVKEYLHFRTNEKNLFQFGKHLYKMVVYYNKKEIDCKIISMIDDTLTLEVGADYIDNTYYDYLLVLYWIRNLPADRVSHYRKNYSVTNFNRNDNIITINGEIWVQHSDKTTILIEDGHYITDIISYINRTLNFNLLLDEN